MMSDGRAERTSEDCPTGTRRNGEATFGFCVVLDFQSWRRGMGLGDGQQLLNFQHSTYSLYDVLYCYYIRSIFYMFPVLFKPPRARVGPPHN